MPAASIRSALLFTAILIAAHPGAPLGSSPDSLTEGEDRIQELRSAGKFGEALTEARNLLESRRSRRSREYEIADVQRTIDTLEAILALEPSARREVTLAESLTPFVSDPVGACDAPERVRSAGQQFEIRRRYLGPLHPDVATSLYHLGRWENEAGNAAVADSLYREALKIRRAALGPDHPLVAETLQALALELCDSGNPSAADSLMVEIARIRDLAFGAGDHSERARTLILAATVAWARGDYPNAKVYLDESLAMRLRLFGVDHPDVLESAAGVAAADLQIGDLAGAERLNLQALALQRKYYSKAPCQLTSTLYNMAHILREQGNPQEAIPFLTEALEIQRRTDPEDPVIGSYLNLLGLIYQDLDRYDDAIRVYTEGNQIEMRRWGPGHPTLQQANLAMALMSAGRSAEADAMMARLVKEALARPEVDENLLAAFRDYQGQCADRLGHCETAETLSLKALEFSLKRGEAAHPRVITTYQRLSQYRIGQGDFRGSENYLTRSAEAFEVARSKAGTGTRAATFRRTPYESRALVRLELDRRADAWADIERARGRLLAEVVTPADSVPFDLDRIQRALPPETAIVGWADHQLRFGEPLTARSWGYVIRKDGPVMWERLPRPTDEATKILGRRLRAFRARIVAGGASTLGVADASAIWPDAAALWKERFAPLEKYLRGIRTLVIVPSGPMSGFPVDVLRSPDGILLGDRFALIYVPSASLYAWLIEHRKAHRSEALSALLVADPPFRQEHAAAPGLNRGEAAAAGCADSTVLRGAVRGERSSLASLPRLRWSRTEATDVARVLTSPVVLLGADASEVSLDGMANRGDLRSFDILHFATHALVDNTIPDRSALVLSQLGLAAIPVPGSYDGLVTAGEIASRWKLDADLVTLSGCETALGRDIFGEGMVGFEHCLISAGARCVLASLWTVDDEATALLMGRFYQNWQGKAGAPGDDRAVMTKSEALKEAKAWLRGLDDGHGRRRFAHPFYWSGFVLIGDGS